jgi:hypothetical protein
MNSVGQRCIRLVFPVRVALAFRAMALPAQAYTAAESRAFDRGDRESRDLIASINCLNRLSTAVQENRVVAYEKWMVARQCLVIARHFVYVAIGGDTTFTHPDRISAYDLSMNAPYVGLLDTSRVIAIARAEWNGTSRFGKQFDDAKRPAVPLTFRFDGNSIEVWMLPLPLLTGNPWSLGGELGAVYSPDGRRLVREIDQFAEFRPVPVPDTGTVQIPSRQRRIPSLSEFLLANQLNARGRNVAIDLPGISSVLASTQGAPWIQVVRR